MMAILTFICFVFLCGFTIGHPATDDIKSKFLVNGQENEPRMEYDAIETPTQINGIGDEPVEDSPKQDPHRPPPPPPPPKWIKYTSDTSWCTIDGRSLITADTDEPITPGECQKRCMDENPECQAVEFWETYNYACFECTDLELVTPYTNEEDLAFPVYVWVKEEKPRKKPAY